MTGIIDREAVRSGAPLRTCQRLQLGAAICAPDREVSEHLVHRQVFVRCMGQLTNRP